MGDPSKLKSTGDNTQMSSISDKRPSGIGSQMQNETIKTDHDIMPVMETIPLAWVQINEGATIIDILHHCMLVDTQRDTVKLFNHINR